MLGFSGPEFKGERPLIVFLVVVGLLLLNIVLKVVRGEKKSVSEKDWIERSYEKVASWPPVAHPGRDF